jgi:steroid delta-isomerase-like uncharacterized protein
MSDANKALIQLWCDEGFNKRNMAIADQVYAADVFYHEPAAGEVHGVEHLKHFVGTWLQAFPDARLIIEDQVAEGEKVATRWTFVGTHRDFFRGVPATGRHISMSAMYFYLFAHGKVSEIRAMVDSHGLFKQLTAATASHAAVDQ